MIIILGLVILVAAVIVGVTGVLTNGGSAHGLGHGFAVFGYHVTGSTGTLFLSGIVVGAVGLFGLWLLLTGAGSRSPAARPPLSPRNATISSTSAIPAKRTPPARWQTPRPAPAPATARTTAASSAQTKAAAAGRACSGAGPPLRTPPQQPRSRCPAKVPPASRPTRPLPQGDS
jgi:hypothetical protein